MIGTVAAAPGPLSLLPPFSAMAIAAISNAMNKTAAKTHRFKELMITPSCKSALSWTIVK
jgi:hypothetical protein